MNILLNLVYKLEKSSMLIDRYKCVFLDIVPDVGIVLLFGLRCESKLSYGTLCEWSRCMIYIIN